MNTEIRELTNADLDVVSGGITPEGWVYCPFGSKKGGTDGLYSASSGDVCAPDTFVNVVKGAVLAGAQKAAGQA